MLPGEGQGLREPTPAMRGAAPTRDGGRGRTTACPSAPAGPQEEAPGVGWKVCRDPRPGAGRQGGLSCPMGCGILVTRAGTEPTSLALECRFLITGPAGESLYFHCAMDPHVEQLVLGLI